MANSDIFAFLFAGTCYKNYQESDIELVPVKACLSLLKNGFDSTTVVLRHRRVGSLHIHCWNSVGVYM